VIDVHVKGVLAQHLGEEETGERQLDQHVLVQRLEQFKKKTFYSVSSSKLKLF
jgi:hypothetical protein